jgi:hypothetical protein
MIRSVIHWLRQHPSPLSFLFFVGLVLWLAWRIPSWFPGWDSVASRLLHEHLLFVITLSIILVFLLFWLLLWKLPQWQVTYVFDVKDRIDLESKVRQTMAQIVGGAAILGGLYFTAQTLRTSQETLRVNQETLQTTQEGQITDRFTKAIDQLGKETLDVRLGGIYALERIAKDSPKDYGPIMEVLTAYVREHAPWPPKDTQSKDSPTIQAILTVLGRRVPTQEKGKSESLDLSKTDLREADLEGAHLERAFLVGTHLDGAQLGGAHLERARLEGANLEGANLGGAALEGANLFGADLGAANLEGANLEGANLGAAELGGAELERAILERARLEGANLATAIALTQAQVNTACVDKYTRLPEGLTMPRPCPANP